MKVAKRSRLDIKKEDAHNSSGLRKVYASKDHVSSLNFEMMTHGYLPAGKTFEWHEHTDTEEIMVVMSGKGTVRDEDGSYDYEAGDVFIFPPNVKHEIHNPSSEVHEMIFVRIKL